MAKNPKPPIPDAWDDDWESPAAKAEASNDEQVDQEDGGAPLSKKERLQKHREANRKIWEEAENAKKTFHFLEATSAVPLATSFQPQVKVLSRKPMIAKRSGDPATGMAGMSLQDDDDDDDEDSKKPKETPEERAAMHKLELEEKKRKYEEARRRLFGDEDESAGASVQQASGARSGGGGESRARGRGKAGRGGGGGSRGGGLGGDARRQAPGGGDEWKLYDPNYAPKPRPGTPQKRQGREDEPMQAVREPRGPDGGGRGFGIRRGGS